MLSLKSYFWWGKRDKKPVPDKMKLYIESSRERFLKQYEISTASVNIEPIVYQQKELDQLLSDFDNNLEKVWKSRIMYSDTPIGGVAMYYDIFKQGFSYWCDQPFVNYDVLNAVAMKYVSRFQCLDFFMDENVVPNGKTSPLIVWYKDTPVEKKTDSGESGAVVTKDAPFAKLKNYSLKTGSGSGAASKSKILAPRYFKTQYPWFWRIWHRFNYYLVFPIYRRVAWCYRTIFGGILWFSDRVIAHMLDFRPDWRTHDQFGKPWNKNDNKEAVVDEEVPQKEKIRNRFIYLGRFRNFSPIQTPRKPSIIGGFSTKFDSGFDAKISYKSFIEAAVIPLKYQEPKFPSSPPTVEPEESWVDL